MSGEKICDCGMPRLILGADDPRQCDQCGGHVPPDDKRITRDIAGRWVDAGEIGRLHAAAEEIRNRPSEEAWRIATDGLLPVAKTLPGVGDGSEDR